VTPVSSSSRTAPLAAGASAAPSPGIECLHCALPVPVFRRDGGSTAGHFCCFGCRFAYGLARPGSGVDDGKTASVPHNTLVLRLGLGIFLAINIMVFSWVFYSGELFGPVAAPGEPYRPLFGLFAYLLMFLCSVVVVALGFPLAGDALDRIRAPVAPGSRLRGRVDANVLICIGVGAAFALSAIHTLLGRGSLYFDTAAMVLVIVTLGQYLEAGAKRRAAGAAGDLLASVPRRAWVRRGDRVLEIDTAEVNLGEDVRLRAGESAVVDGIVIEGASRVDESSMTGESRPRAVQPGDRLLAGSVNLDGALWLRAESVGDDTAVSRVETMLLEARLRQPAIQRAADRASALFVPGVVLIALGVFSTHALRGTPTQGLFNALSVLLISCPCALGLATPLATWNALRQAARRGIVIESAATLERAAAVDRVFFDKTGTLTERRLRLARIELAAGVTERQALELAAGLELTSLHPIADALVDAARRCGAEPSEVSRGTTLPGLGLEGRIAGRLYKLGSGRLVGADGDEGGATTTVYLADTSRVLARFELEEALRGDARDAIASLSRLGVEARVLTGDRPGPALLLETALGIDVASDLLPDDKLARLEAARDGGGVVAMVGDGINDAPVLAAADVGIAMGSAADLAKQAGNVHLIADKLDRVPLTLGLARHAMRRIRMNLAWAFGYNTLGITLAALGLLTPVFAASAMFFSSLIVVAFSRGAGSVSRESLGLPGSTARPKRTVR
jgi:heavy metal translocating P-type ATPase